MNVDRISEETLQYNRLKISNDPQTSNWSIIAVNSNNNFIKFYKLKPLAAILQIPYIIWLLFAGYLNLAIYFHNR